MALLAVASLAVLRDEQIDQIQASMLATARAVMAAVDSEFDSSVQALESLGTARALRAGDMHAFYEDAERVLAKQSTWKSLAVFNASGKYLFDLRQPLGAELPEVPANAESLQRAIKSRRPQVSRLIVGEVTPEPVIALNVPVMRDGAVTHVITAGVSPESLLGKSLANEINDRGGLGAVLDDKGTIVARSRGHAEFVGKPASEAVRSLIARGGPGWERGPTLDSGDSYRVYTHSDFSGLLVAFTLPVDAVLAPLQRSYLILAGGLLLALAVALTIAAYLASRMSESVGALVDAARAIGRGESASASYAGIAELREVAAALAAAGAARAAAATERERLLERERDERAVADNANRSKDEFLAMLGHELRNPLGAISNAVLLIGDSRLTVAQRDSALAVAQRQSAQMKRLVDDLLDVGRVVTGKIYLERRRIDVAAQVAETVASLAGSDPRVTVEAGAMPAWIDADPTRIDQIVANLLSNARRHTPADGEIRISVSTLEGEAVIVFADNGEGIRAEALPLLYDLFFQGAQPLDRQQSGLGIGLTLVQRLVALHGGTISAASDGPGRGAVFTVRLPLAECEALVPLPGAASGMHASLAARDILIVEDNEDARQTLGLLLEMHGMRVTTAANGPAGLAKARESKPDVALIDIGLPGMDGDAVARELRARYGRSITLIALTGYGSDADARAALDAGFDAHLTKPVDLEELLSMVVATGRSGVSQA